MSCLFSPPTLCSAITVSPYIRNHWFYHYRVTEHGCGLFLQNWRRGNRGVATLSGNVPVYVVGRQTKTCMSPFNECLQNTLLLEFWCRVSNTWCRVVDNLDHRTRIKLLNPCEWRQSCMLKRLVPPETWSVYSQSCMLARSSRLPDPEVTVNICTCTVVQTSCLGTRVESTSNWGEQKRAHIMLWFQLSVSHGTTRQFCACSVNACFY